MKAKERNEVVKTLILILQIGITMLVPIIMCTLAGAFLGSYFGMKWIAVVAFVIGSIAGFQNVYRLIKRFLRQEESPGQRKRAEDEAAAQKAAEGLEKK